MARPIEATPKLTDRYAEALLRQMQVNQPVSAERVLWLDKLAEEIKPQNARSKPLKRRVCRSHWLTWKSSISTPKNMMSLDSIVTI